MRNSEAVGYNFSCEVFKICMKNSSNNQNQKFRTVVRLRLRYHADKFVCIETKKMKLT